MVPFSTRLEGEVSGYWARVMSNGHDVFISASSRDKAVAEASCAALESRGIRCWIAPRNITPGQNWGEAIVNAISNARVMVLLYSGHANKSPQVLREVERAVHKNLVIVPFRIEDVPLSKAMEYFISAPHWLNAFPSPESHHFTFLAETVAQLLAIPRVSDTAAGTIHSDGPSSASPPTTPSPPEPAAQTNLGTTWVEVARIKASAAAKWEQLQRLNPAHGFAELIELAGSEYTEAASAVSSDDHDGAAARCRALVARADEVLRLDAQRTQAGAAIAGAVSAEGRARGRSANGEPNLRQADALLNTARNALMTGRFVDASAEAEAARELYDGAATAAAQQPVEQTNSRSADMLNPLARTTRHSPGQYHAVNRKFLLLTLLALAAAVALWLLGREPD
jgi:hypothetical protein